MVRRAVALAAMLLIAAVALCLVDGGTAGGDLCGDPALSSGGTGPPLLGVLAGSVLPRAAELYALSPSDRPSPPPRA